MLLSQVKSAVLVVAHPDDEILWFSSIVDKVAAIVFCYLDVPEQAKWTEGRHRISQSYPVPNATFLGVVESRAYQGALYRKEGCWTWPYDGYVPFTSETFFGHDDSTREQFTQRRQCRSVLSGSRTSRGRPRRLWAPCDASLVGSSDGSRR